MSLGRCRVIADYHSAYPNPIVLRSGDHLTVEDRKTEWDGWLWCTSKENKSGWVPESYIKRDRERGISLRDYDAAELSVAKGDLLMIIEMECGWLRCQCDNGRIGWVPEANVEKLDQIPDGD
jgi:hypothetical protein